MALGLRDIGLKEEYRSSTDDIVTEFFFPCLNSCVEYHRCVDLLSIHTLTTIATAFENFAAGKARLRMITGHRFRTADLNMLAKMLVEKAGIMDGMHIGDSETRMLQGMVAKGQFEIKIAIPNSEYIADSFSERIGIFMDEKGDAVAFTGVSRESFSTQTRDFESVDVFTSWNDESRVRRKMRDFDELWEDRTNHVDVYDFAVAVKNNLLKYSSDWILRD